MCLADFFGIISILLFILALACAFIAMLVMVLQAL